MKFKAEIIKKSYSFRLRINADNIKFQKYLSKIWHKGQTEVVLNIPNKSKTPAQLRTIYALIAAWQDTGAHSAPEFVCDRESFKLYCKFFYGTEARQGLSAKEKNEGLKSLAEYDKYESQQFIDSLLSAIRESGAQSEKLEEVFCGLEAQ